MGTTPDPIEARVMALWGDSDPQAAHGKTGNGCMTQGKGLAASVQRETQSAHVAPLVRRRGRTDRGPRVPVSVNFGALPARTLARVCGRARLSNFELNNLGFCSIVHRLGSSSKGPLPLSNRHPVAACRTRPGHRGFFLLCSVLGSSWSAGSPWVFCRFSLPLCCSMAVVT